MKVSVISIGHELLMGKTLNRHVVTLARMLKSIGLDIDRAFILRDDKDAIQAQLKTMDDDVIIFTGGLGPTPDDLTKETVCEFYQLPLFQHEPSLKAMEVLFERYGIAMPSSNLKQAMFPKDATVIENAVGTAPGMIMDVNDGPIIILLPGPPVELEPMLPAVKNYLLQTFHEHRYEDGFLVAGIGESEMNTLLEGLFEAHKDVYIAPYAGNGEIQYYFTSTSKNKLQAALIAFQKRASNYIVGPYQQTFESLIYHHLHQRKETLAVAESMTTGLVSARLGDVPGISSVLKESLVVYSDEAKVRYLGVDPDLIKKETAVSESVAKAMVEGLEKVSQADLCAAITGFAGPTHEKSVPVGTVIIAVKYRGQVTLKTRQLSGDRVFVRFRSAAYMLYDMLRSVLDHGRQD
jgi:nicotinamide-nucleotide amidase